MLVLRVPHSAKYLGARAKVGRQELCLCNYCKQFFRVACASSCISPKPWQKEGVGRLHAKGDEWQLSEARSIFRQDEALGLSLPKQRAEGSGEGTRKPVCMQSCSVRSGSGWPASASCLSSTSCGHGPGIGARRR